MSLYKAPDIRLQKIEQAEAHIAQKRVKRLITLQTYKQKKAEKDSKIKDAELEKFRKQVEKIDKLHEKITEDIEKMARMIKELGNTHNRITNVEQGEIQL